MARYGLQKSSLPIVLLGLTGLVLLASVFGFLVFGPAPVPVDRKTGCPVAESSIPVRTAILIDRTDRLNEVQKEAIRIAFRNELERATSFERVALYEILGRELANFQPVVVGCNPRIASTGTSWWNRLWRVLETDELVERKRFSDQFLNRLEDALNRGLSIDEQRDSPIMEMIQAVSETDLRKGGRQVRRRMIIFSDMMQHGPEYSHYRNGSSRTFFGSPSFRKVETDLTGTDVLVFYIRRLDTVGRQPRIHKQFWTEYFSRLGAQFSITEITAAAWKSGEKSVRESGRK